MTKLIEVEEGAKETPVVLQMEGKAKLFGSVTVTGEMPEQMTVVLSPRGDTGSRTTTEGRSWAGLTYSVVAEDGRFEVDGLKPGEYTVSAYHRDGGGMAHGSTQVEVPADGSIDVTIELKTRER